MFDDSLYSFTYIACTSTATKFKENMTAASDVREWFERFKLYAEDTSIFVTWENPEDAPQIASLRVERT